MRRVIEEAAKLPTEDGWQAVLAGLLDLAARWTPDPLASILSQAMELAAWEGREQVFLDDYDVRFAFEVVRLPFREQIEFLRQKRVKPTKSWLDALHGVHDRSFVVAGVTDLAMLEEFQAAIIDVAENGRYVEDFAKDFDRLVEKYGWEYRGERNWRIRTIFETNVRTSFMAGRLRQMRDPDVVKLRPYWQYLHGESRTPKVPRVVHLGWHGLVLMHDDPWWNVHFPPNDWLCSCGVRTLSRRALERLGKSGPDPAPRDALIPRIDKATGEFVMQPAGIGKGWEYMPGDLWERGLVPSALIDEAGGKILTGRHAVSIDTPSPLEELLAAARPFTAQPLPDQGLSEEDYVRAFLKRFGADIGQAVLWQDPSGHRVPISEQFFQTRDGRWKVGKRGRAILTPLMAEALLDPDEIWLGVAKKADPINPDLSELLLDRRYIRVDPELGIVVVMEMGRKWWEPITIYDPTKKSGRPDLNLLNLRRGGKLIWKRK